MLRRYAVISCDRKLMGQNTNPHDLYILYHIVLYYGHRHPSLFKSHRKWRKLLPTLGEVVGNEGDEVGQLASQSLLTVQDLRTWASSYRDTTPATGDSIDV